MSLKELVMQATVEMTIYFPIISGYDPSVLLAFIYGLLGYLSIS